VLSDVGRTCKSGFMASGWGQVVEFTRPSLILKTGKLGPQRTYGYPKVPPQEKTWPPSQWCRWHTGSSCSQGTGWLRKSLTSQRGETQVPTPAQPHP
jgi:hypothetical protein